MSHFLRVLSLSSWDSFSILIPWFRFRFLFLFSHVSIVLPVSLRLFASLANNPVAPSLCRFLLFRLSEDVLYFAAYVYYFFGVLTSRLHCRELVSRMKERKRKGKRREWGRESGETRSCPRLNTQSRVLTYYVTTACVWPACDACLCAFQPAAWNAQPAQFSPSLCHCSISFLRTTWL